MQNIRFFNGKTLIVVSTPFQCVCAIEAISYFKISKYDVVIISHNRIEEMGEVLALNNISYDFIRSSKYISFIFRHVLTKSLADYDNAICGDFKSPRIPIYLARNVKRKGKIVYIDDGFTSIYPLNGINIGSMKSRLRMFIARSFMMAKRIDDRTYYSIFKAGKTRHVVYKNELDVIKKRISGNREGIFILGTVNQFVDSILPEGSIVDYVEGLLLILKKRYPKERFFYSPHGRAKESKLLTKVLDSFNVITIKSKSIVEIDYVLRNYNPKVIAAFGSTALISLKKVFPECEMYNVYLPSKLHMFTKKNNMINKYLSVEGIETIYVV